VYLIEINLSYAIVAPGLLQRNSVGSGATVISASRVKI